MGYVNDTQMVRIIPPTDFAYVTGTWSDAVASNQWSKSHTAAADTPTVRIPVNVPLQNSNAFKGCFVKSLDIWYSIATAVMTSVTATIYKLTAPLDNAAPAAPATPAFSYDAGHTTNGMRVAVQNHKMTLTLTTPIWLADTDVLFVELTLSAGATSAYLQKEARVNFNLRA